MANHKLSNTLENITKNYEECFFYLSSNITLANKYKNLNTNLI